MDFCNKMAILWMPLIISFFLNSVLFSLLKFKFPSCLDEIQTHDSPSIVQYSWLLVLQFNQHNILLSGMKHFTFEEWLNRHGLLSLEQKQDLIEVCKITRGLEGQSDLLVFHPIVLEVPLLYLNAGYVLWQHSGLQTRGGLFGGRVEISSLTSWTKLP